MKRRTRICGVGMADASDVMYFELVCLVQNQQAMLLHNRTGVLCALLSTLPTVMY